MIEENTENIYNQDTWNIGTHNIRGFNEKTKQILFFQFCQEKNIDIIGITETSLPPNHYIKDEEHNYQIWTSNPTTQYTGAGVGIAVANKWAQHVYNIKEHSNRGIYIDMAFKGKISYRIINIYNPSNQTNKKERQELYNWLNKSINEAENLK
jgi:Endonuclease/Exonuclease/phosphatase family.